jgi:hypothetical protein
MEINLWAVLVCGIVSMIVGFIWFGPLFGRKWTEIIGATEADLEARKEMQNRAMPLYFVSFALSLFQAYVLAHFIKGWQDASAYETSIWIWAAFIIPTVAAGAMWNNDSKRISWARFLINAGYYLVLFIIFALILSLWQ